MDSLRPKTLFSTILLAIVAAGAFVVSGQSPAPKSQEVSDIDGQPVLLRHLPEYENVRSGAIFGTERSSLERTMDDRGVLRVIEFPLGTEYVTANYPQGRLLIVEYTNPQSSLETDSKVQQYFNSQGNQAGEIYRRIGNYNAFVFDAQDPAAANALLDQIKYEKTVQWLGEDPYLLRRLERYMLTTSKDIMISTVLVIVFGIGGAILAGIAAGFIFFRVRKQQRAHRTTFSDAGGLTRLNLDGLSD